MLFAEKVNNRSQSESRKSLAGQNCAFQFGMRRISIKSREYETMCSLICRCFKTWFCPRIAQQMAIVHCNLCMDVCISIFSVNNGNDLVSFLSLSLSVSSCVHAFRDCRWLHNFATFYEFGFVLFTAISFSTSFSFFLLSFRIRIFIIAFACYAVISSLFTLAMRCEAEQGKIRTGKKNVERKAYNFCIEKLLHQSYRRNNKKARNYGNCTHSLTKPKK